LIVSAFAGNIVVIIYLKKIWISGFDPYLHDASSSQRRHLIVFSSSRRNDRKV